MKTNAVRYKMGTIYLIMVIISVAISSIFSAYDYISEGKRLRQDFNDMISPVSERLAINMARPIWVESRDRVSQLIESEMANKKIYAVVIREPDKKVFIARERDEDWNIVESKGDISGDFVERTAEISYNEDTIGILDIFFSTRHVKESLKNLRYSMASKIVAMSLVLTGILLIIVNRLFVKPVSKVVKGLHAVGEQVGYVSSKIAASSYHLTEGVLEQAAAVEETSSSLEQITSMSQQNTISANNANNMMTETSALATEAASSMENLISSIQEISNTSEETRKVIKTIDEFAFQTNLLALNAAVEAARAGKAGAGFAVVADEVRNLALRSGEAARNITTLIETSIERTKHGMDMVGKVSQLFTDMAKQSKKVGALFGNVVKSSQEQSLGISHVSKAMSDIDQVTQGNAANAEQTSAAIEEIRDQVEIMNAFVLELMGLINIKSEKYNKLAIGKTKPAVGKALPFFNR